VGLLRPRSVPFSHYDPRHKDILLVGGDGVVEGGLLKALDFIIQKKYPRQSAIQKWRRKREVEERWRKFRINLVPSPKSG